MVLIKLAPALAAASMLLLAVADDDSTSTSIKNPIETPSKTLPASAMSSIGCFETGIPLENHGSYKFQTPGNCQLICIEQNKNVMGVSDGENCWCGDKIPAQEWQTDNETCSTTCSGGDDNLCGGAGALWVVLTGNTRNKVPYYEPSSSSSSSAMASASAARQSSAAAASATDAPSMAPPPPQSESKPNTVAIAVGVVVGIIGLAAILFGVWFMLRRRRQHQAEEDYRRQAASVNAFVNGGKNTSHSSMNDSRLDPSFVDRRQSNGSIADNEDYSRRILKVTNA